MRTVTTFQREGERPFRVVTHSDGSVGLECLDEDGKIKPIPRTDFNWHHHEMMSRPPSASS